MSDDPLSQSRIATYAKCQRLYEFRYDWDVTVSDQTERYFERGNVLHNTIEDLCKRVTAEPTLTDEDIRELALNRVDNHWNDRMDRSEYYSDAEFKEDYLATRARIEAFFDEGPGYHHVRDSVETEKYVSFDRNGRQYHGYIDNIVETANGLLLVDYKTSSVKPPFSREYVRAHIGEDYRPDRVKPAVQAALYLEGIKTTDLYSPEMNLEFEFYELKKYRGRETNRTPEDVTITIEGNRRSVTDGYRNQHEDVWNLIEQYTDQIANGIYKPDPFETIFEKTCESCEYRSICPEYINEEVSRI